MAEIVEGRNAVAEALRSGRRPERVLVAEGATPDPALAEIERLAGAAGVRVERVPRRQLDRLSARGAHQGVVAYVQPFRFAELADVIAGAADRSSSLIVVLDHILDPGNLGAVIRSAAAAGADAVVVASDRSAPMSQVALKSAAGAAELLPIVRVTNIARALEALKKAGYWAAGAAGEAGVDAWDAPLEGRLVLVLGSEGGGLSRLVAERCDFLVSIPMAPGVESLNVAQAATVLAFEWRRRGAHPPVVPDGD